MASVKGIVTGTQVKTKVMKKTAELIFNREKIGASYRLSKELLSYEGRVSLSEQESDFVQNTLTAHIETFIYSRTLETQKVNVYHKRPTFFDWLFRRTIYIDVDVKCREVLKNPQSTGPQVVLLYDAKQSDNAD